MTGNKATLKESEESLRRSVQLQRAVAQVSVWSVEAQEVVSTLTLTQQAELKLVWGALGGVSEADELEAVKAFKELCLDAMTDAAFRAGIGADETELHELALRTACQVDKADGGFVEWAMRQMSARKSGRLSAESVAAVLDKQGEGQIYAEMPRLIELAGEGMALEVPAGFVGTGVREEFEKIRDKYEQVRPAVHTLVAKLVRKGVAWVLPASVARLVPNYHTRPIHWVPKVGSDLGRLIADDSSGVEPINGPEMKEFFNSAEGWGKPDSDKLVEMVRMVVDGVDACKQEGQVAVLSKEDVQGAFRLMDLKLESIPRAAMECRLANGVEISVITNVGYFGYTGTPAAWGVLARFIVWVLRIMVGFATIYVDDILRVHPQELTAQHAAQVKQLICDLLSPGSTAAYAEDKSEHGVFELEFVGWMWDVDDMSLRMTKRNIVKFMGRLVRVLSSAVRGEGVQLKVLQAVSSCAYRYSELDPALRVLCGPLYDMAGRERKYHSDLVKLSVGPAATAAMCLWKVTLRDWWNGVGGRRKFRTWTRERKALRVRVRTDGSWMGCGCLIWEPGGSTDSMQAAKYQFPWGERARESKYQNAREYIGIVLVVATVLRDQRQTEEGLNFELEGDSATALKWAKSYSRGEFSTRANLLFSALLTESGCVVANTQHYAGTSAEMKVVDSLSRKGSVDEESGKLGAGVVSLPAGWYEEAIEFMDPRKDTPTTLDEWDDASEFANVLTHTLLQTPRYL